MSIAFDIRKASQAEQVSKYLIASHNWSQLK